MTLILAADTATNLNTIALCECGGDGTFRIRVECATYGARLHAERIVSVVDWVLAQGGAALADVDLLAVSNGPGSFTGLRIGVATWKGLAFATDKPLIGVPTLDAMARAASVWDGIVCPLLDARMGEVFGAVYRYEDGARVLVKEALAAPVETVLEEVAGPAVLLGDGIAPYRERIAAVLPDARYAPAWVSVPSAAAVAAEAAALAAEGASTDAAEVAPVYLRKAKVDLRGVPGGARSGVAS